MNDKNIIVNKPEPKPGILERGDLFAIAVGMVIGSGMVTLIGPAMAYTGYSVWLAYLTAIVMGFFMVFPYIILGGTMRVACFQTGLFCRKEAVFLRSPGFRNTVRSTGSSGSLTEKTDPF